MTVTKFPSIHAAMYIENLPKILPFSKFIQICILSIKYSKTIQYQNS